MLEQGQQQTRPHLDALVALLRGRRRARPLHGGRCHGLQGHSEQQVAV